MDCYTKLKDMLYASYPVLYLTTYEYKRTIDKLLSIVNELREKSETVNFYIWNCVDGLVIYNTQNKPDSIVTQKNENFPQEEDIVSASDALEFIRKRIGEKIKERSSERDIFIFEDLHNNIEQPDIIYILRNISEKARFAKSHAILLSASYNLPLELEKYVTVLNIPLPGRIDLERTLAQVEKNYGSSSLSTKERNDVLNAALGMTTQEADLAFCLAAIRDGLGKNTASIVSAEKEQIIRKSGILDYFSTNERMEDVGGLDNLKNWLQRRQKSYEKSAREWGLQEPKGLLLVGVPGCGKSLTAKCIASTWNMPLLRLDLGKVFQGLVGSSEDNMRKALDTAEVVAPCVLWIDEIEKGLSGIQSSGATDGGVTARVFSTILTWMQEKTAPVFVVATANNIDLLPHELLRKGRFDEIFFVDLPDKEERRNIFKIHINKKGINPSNLITDLLIEKTEGYNGAEIAECVNEAMFTAYIENPDSPQLLAKHLQDAVEKTIPLSITMPHQMERLKKFAASGRCKGASKDIPVTNKEFKTRQEEDMEDNRILIKPLP